MFCCNTIGNVFRIVIVGGCAFALVMQWLNMLSCDFFHSDGNTVNVGIWYKGYDDECDLDEFYGEDDVFVITARSSILISMLCGVGALVAVLFEWLFCKIPCAGCLEGLAFVGAWACGLGVYMLYLVEACGQVDDLLAANDDMISNIGSNIIPDGIPTAMECTWGQGSTYNLLACIAYLGCGILLCFAPKPDPLFF
mmetsp:Transcript_19212/g.41749  ORF Transcript_19212/g.41749 Transcript_19212/m.41749 type:complete len:196 (+) Transcript_19212:103-690(+)